MELIYVQTRLKGQGSPQLALEIRKKDRQFATAGSDTYIMNVLSLDR